MLMTCRHNETQWTYVCSRFICLSLHICNINFLRIWFHEENSDGLVQPRLGHATPARRNQMALGLNRHLGLFCLTNCVYCDPMMHGSLFLSRRKYTFLVWPRFISTFLVWPDLSRVMSGMRWDVLRLRLAKTKTQDVWFLLGEAWGKLGVLVGALKKLVEQADEAQISGEHSLPEIFCSWLPSWAKQQEGTLNYFEFVSELIGRQQHDAGAPLELQSRLKGDVIWLGPREMCRERHVFWNSNVLWEQLGFQDLAICNNSTRFFQCWPS